MGTRTPEPETLLMVDDERGFYGRRYYEHHMTNQLGLPSITERARSDLTDRCIHWLRTLMKYKLPPSRILEVGSAHGGFLFLMGRAGFDATGIEMSPWLVNLAEDTFGVPMLLGPIEQQDLEARSLDGIVLMDVVEHLPDPVGTLRHCLGLLKPDGIIIIQTPEYEAGKTLAELQAAESPFLKHFSPEHLHLFSRESIRKLMSQLGAPHIQFEPAIFSFYDMFLVASKVPLFPVAEEEVLAALTAKSGSRLTLALLDIDTRLADFRRWHAELNADRAHLHKQVEELEGLRSSISKSEDDRATAQANLDLALTVLNRIDRSLVYRLMRKLGLWSWIADGLATLGRRQ